MANEAEASSSSLPSPSTSEDSLSSSSNSSSSNKRSLRKRKLDLNRLSSSLTCPQICKFQYCGIQLRDGDSLDWHYEGHLAQEIEKLDKVRVKKSSIKFREWKNLESIRFNAFRKIQFRREARTALPVMARDPSSSTRCPVCDLPINEDDYKVHVDACLRLPQPDNDDDDNEEVDVDGSDSFEEYEWAGQRRIRATSLVEGGLRGGDGFLTITPGNEDEELDIEGDSDEDSRTFGPSQYSDSDIILSSAETPEEEIERTSLRTALGISPKDPTGSPPGGEVSEIPSPSPSSSSSSPVRNEDDLKKKVIELMKENQVLRQQVMCNVCMDAYDKPLVSLGCWHVHCEQCWLRALGAKKLCPQCKVIIRPQDLRRIYL